ncbi:hypothetical protein JTE90_024637 [Oedothorax gibbosus]|uniref:Sulfide:quinone oxidoreductase, mitochondrial n=1 Tax=Oedothorax gibbosus TaxID=931172 RepID=A0AAV6U1W5_9ARAC|nr:hypothetical protein JTE90_024637 [Oedothorax gibbosus]
MNKILGTKCLAIGLQMASSPNLIKASFSTSTFLFAEKCKFLIAGGGTGGITMAAKILNMGEKSVTVIEPSEVHYYQPYFTLIGGKKKKLENSNRPTSSVMPKGAKWIKDKVAKFDPASNTVVTESNGMIEYEYLIVALGMKLAFDKVKGLTEALETKGVCSIYSPRTVLKTAQALDDFRSGNAIFTHPVNPIKCGGAPQKIMYLAEEYFSKNGKRDQANIIFNSAIPVFFAVSKYAKALEAVAKSKNISINFLHNLVEVKPDTKEAVFDVLDKTGASLRKEVMKYEMLHVTPPMVAPWVIKSSPLSDASGFMDINKNTLQSKVFSNVFGLGDCTNAPTSKTAAAVAGQCGVLAQNIKLALDGKALNPKYFGYTSCPLVTGYNKGILAEFNYEMVPEETLPINQRKERSIFFYMKKDLMPFIYWNLMLKGYWSGPKYFRKLFHLWMV